MSAVLTLAAAGFVTWILRIGLIGIVPARKLPPKVRGALEVTGPAAMAALIVNDLMHEASKGTDVLTTALTATVVAAVVTWRYQNMALVATAGIATYWGLSLVI